MNLAKLVASASLLFPSPTSEQYTIQHQKSPVYAQASEAQARDENLEIMLMVYKSLVSKPGGR